MTRTLHFHCRGPGSIPSQIELLIRFCKPCSAGPNKQVKNPLQDNSMCLGTLSVVKQQRKTDQGTPGKPKVRSAAGDSPALTKAGRGVLG